MKLTCPNCGAQGNLDVREMTDGHPYLACSECDHRFNVKIRKNRNNVLVARDLNVNSLGADCGNMLKERDGGPFLWLLGIRKRHESLPAAGSTPLKRLVKSA